MKKMQNDINELEKLIEDINVNEIAAHVDQESLWNWCGAWRHAAMDALNRIKGRLAVNERV